MTKPAAVALPDTPELPAEIEQWLDILIVRAQVVGELIVDDPTLGNAEDDLRASLASLRSVISKHLLTAKEAWAILDQPVSPWGLAPELVEKLRLLSGSSRGEE